MLRSYAIVIMNMADEIIDRFNLDLVTNPKGNGFELQLDTITTDIEDIITNVKQKKPKITMDVLQTGDSYLQANILTSWLQKYSTEESNMFLEYNDTKVIKYCGGKVTKLGKTERNQQGFLSQPLEFTMTTPFFIKRENTIVITKSSYGKKYPYSYPYSYGGDEITNNAIENVYITRVPVTITIKGLIQDPVIMLHDENGDVYTQIHFNNVEIKENDRLVINSAIHKIYKISSTGEITDYRPMIDPQYDKYLFAKQGISSININTDNAGDGFSLTGGWRQYTI